MTAKSILQWLFTKLQDSFAERQAAIAASHPWGWRYRSPFTCGLPLTTELIFKNGYHVWALHYTALRRRLMVWGSVGIVILGLWCGFSDHGLSFFVRPEELFLYCAASALYVLLWRPLCLKITPVKITPGDVYFGWFCSRPYNRVYISEYGVDPHPKAMGHKERERESIDMNDPVLNTYRVFAVYGGTKVKVADVYGMGKAEELKNRLQGIHDFLNTQIDQDMPIETGR